MESLRRLVFDINTRKSNLDGSRESFDNLNLHDVYKLAEPKIEETIV